MRNHRLLILAVLLAIMPIGLTSQTKSSIFGTKHDIAGLGGGCKACHVPHQASATGEALLWAQSFSTTTTFGVYQSATIDTAPQEVGGAYSPTNPPTGAKMYTVLCLSCHDGLTSPTVINAASPSAIASLTSSDGLRNDHPVNLVYNPTSDPGLEPLATIQGSAIKLFSNGTDQTVQCGSCHDVHNNANTRFLRVADTNTKAGLCTVCHK